LVKPQFERTAPGEGFRGVVRDPAELRSILEALAGDLEREGVYLHRAASSALRGAKGNREFFFLLRDAPGPAAADLLAAL
jgi:predicted rRNA methylase YqxC with S4 and FtsJ domains